MTKRQNHRIRHAAPYLAMLIMALAVWAFYETHLSFMFFYKEQNQLFLLSGDYLSTYFTKPSWVACLAGDFITQLFYYMYAGAAIFAALILLLGTTVYKSLGLAGFSRPVALLVALIAMAVETSFGFNPDFRLSSLLCVQGGAIGFLLYALTINCKPWLRLSAITIVSMLTAWMFGFGFVVLTVLIAVSELMGLTKTFRQGTQPHKADYVFIPLCAMLSTAFYFGSETYPVDPATCRTYPGIGSLQLPRQDLEDYLEVDNLYYFGRYDELIKKVEAMKNPSPEVTFYYYLAIAQRGLLPHKLNSVKPVNLGTLYEIGPKSTPAEIKMVNELYFALGDMTLAEREALLTCVFSYDNRNVRMIKRLAECNLVAGDNEAAMKYLRILDNTIAYKKWAQANRPGKINLKLNNLKQYAVKDDTIRLNARFRDVLTNLLKANPRNHMALDYLLCTDYLVGAREMFINDIKEYYIPQYGMPTEPMYRELYK